MTNSLAKIPDSADTIVALASASGAGARAIVRLSGQRALLIASAVCPDFEPSLAAAGRLHSAQLLLAGFSSPIPADIYRFSAPHSYTGQNMIEIHTLASGPIVEVLIASCLNAGARAAQPGEFTLRAFLAGKLDLTRAEAVLGVIDAGDRVELKQALYQLAGGLANPLHEAREDLLNLLADLEAGLDFSEEDIRFVAAEDLLNRLGRALAYLTNLRRQIEQRARSQRAFRVVLAGAPNAGKSSLFNALVGRKAALVSPEPGTTRDYLEATLTWDDMVVELVDIAGHGVALGEVDAFAQSLGQQQVQGADLLLWCWPVGEEARPPVRSGEFLLVGTKADLNEPPAGRLATSAVTGAGIGVLRDQIAQVGRQARQSALAPGLSRCRHHVDQCMAALRQAYDIAIQDEPVELLTFELRQALDELGAMAGAVYTDDLLDRIFSRFCIGK